MTSWRFKLAVLTVAAFAGYFLLQSFAWTLRNVAIGCGVVCAVAILLDRESKHGDPDDDDV